MRHHLLIRIWIAVVSAVLLIAATHGTAHAQLYAKKKKNPTEEDIARAKQHMAAGVAFMQDPDGARYEEAYPEFRGAYERSGSLNALQNLAICAMKLELDGEAIRYFKRFLKKKGDEIDEADKAQVERDLAALQSSVAWITVSSDKTGVTLKDVRTPRSGQPKRNKYEIGIQNTKLGIHPGDHVFTAINTEGEEKKWRVTIKNGDEQQHEFIFNPGAPVTAEGFTTDEPKPVEDEEEEDEGDGGGVHPGVWVGLAVTIAALGVWAGFMGKSAADKSTYDDEILGKKDLSVQQQAADDLKTTNLLADVFLGVAGAGAIATIIIAVATAGGDDAEEEAALQGSHFGVNWKLAPAADPRGGGAVMLTGEF